MSGSVNGGDPCTYKKVEDGHNSHSDYQSQSHGNISLTTAVNSTGTNSSTSNSHEQNSSTLWNTTNDSESVNKYGKTS
ncbi:unnamed protein product [Adineta ricciae]|uniref:Uncharacterized protein n=1 Tax=Adineta ricciae TaxID=249248 RepID=A0A813VS86_ADIRI|nr:unnamed protein product [Adineta ricciae]CAF1567339.1 unnamed protein product [Adineta ricciae]